MIINVTKEHIKQGTDNCKYNNVTVCSSCPVALAIKEAINEPVWVSMTTWRINKSNSKRHLLPAHVSAIIREGLPTTPFSFEIDYEVDNEH
jgi:hypothetical protein